jgi:hypothetical protein
MNDSFSLLTEPLQICRHHCQEDFMTTTIDVWIYVNLSVKELFYEVPIAEVLNQYSSVG